MIAVTLDEWKRNLELPTGETVILHNPKVLFKCKAHGKWTLFSSQVTFCLFHCFTSAYDTVSQWLQGFSPFPI